MVSFEWASEMNSVSFACIDRLVALGFSRFGLQYTDQPYNFRPNVLQSSSDEIKALLATTRLKQDWGMVWAV